MLFNEACSTEEKLLDLGGADELDRTKQRMRAAVSVEHIVRVYHTLQHALAETRVLAAAHTAREMGRGLHVMGYGELEPIDWDNVSTRWARVRSLYSLLVTFGLHVMGYGELEPFDWDNISTRWARVRSLYTLLVALGRDSRGSPRGARRARRLGRRLHQLRVLHFWLL